MGVGNKWAATWSILEWIQHAYQEQRKWSSGLPKTRNWQGAQPLGALKDRIAVWEDCRIAGGRSGLTGAPWNLQRLSPALGRQTPVATLSGDRQQGTAVTGAVRVGHRPKRQEKAETAPSAQWSSDHIWVQHLGFSLQLKEGHW